MLADLQSSSTFQQSNNSWKMVVSKGEIPLAMSFSILAWVNFVWVEYPEKCLTPSSVTVISSMEWYGSLDDLKMFDVSSWV